METKSELNSQINILKIGLNYEDHFLNPFIFFILLIIYIKFLIINLY